MGLARRNDRHSGGHGRLGGAEYLQVTKRHVSATRPRRNGPNAVSQALPLRAGAVDVLPRRPATSSCGGDARCFMAQVALPGEGDLRPRAGRLRRVGAGEAFGEPLELPPREAYAETCAAIRGFMFKLAPAARERARASFSRDEDGARALQRDRRLDVARGGGQVLLLQSARGALRARFEDGKGAVVACAWLAT